MFHQSRLVVYIVYCLLLFIVAYVYSENHHRDYNNSKIFAKETDYIRGRFLEFFFIYSNNDAFNDRTNCFYPTAYYNLKF